MSGIRIRSVFTVTLVVLLIIALLDFSVNGPQVIEGFFGKFESDRQWSLGVEPDTPRKSESGVITRDAGALSRLVITNTQGDIELVGTEEDEVQVDYMVTIYANEEAQAESYLPRVSIRENVTNGILSVVMEEPSIREAGIRGIKVDYVVAVPEALNVEAANQSGRTTVSGLTGDLVLHGQNVSIAEVQGNVDARVRFGSLKITGITGNVTASGLLRSGLISNVTGNLTLDFSQGDMYAENVQGSVDAVQHQGSLSLTGVIGEVSAQCLFGRLDIRDVDGRTVVQGQHSTMNLEDIRDNLRVASQFGNVRLEMDSDEPGYEVSATARHGEIITALPLETKSPENFVQEAAGTIGNGEHQVQLETEQADIYLRSR